MKYQKTILVAALMTAMGSMANAQDWTQIETNNGCYTNFTTQENIFTPTEDKWTYESKLSGSSSDNGNLGVAIVDNTKTLTLASENTLWVRANAKSGESVRIYAFQAQSGAKISNEGTIHIESIGEGNTWSGYARAFLINGSGEANNGGTIYAKRATAMAATNTKGNKTFINSGTIDVSDNGYGIDASSTTGAVTVENSHEIILDASSIGIRVADTNKKNDLTTITNSGSISGKGTAIKVESSAANSQIQINLEGSSRIEGLIDLAKEAVIDMSIRDLDNEESLQVKGEIDKLSVTSSDITIDQVKGSTLTVNNITVLDETSDLTFRLNEVAANETPVLTVSAAGGQNLDSVSYAFSGTVSDEIAAEENFDVAKLFNSINITGLDSGKTTPDEVSVEEGTWGNSLLVTDNGNGNYSTQVLSENSLLRSAKDLALTNALVWRSELTSLSDRMGTLRTHPESTGAWARYTGGNLEGNGVDFDFNSIEIGFDTPVTDTMTLGVSFGYTKGDSDLVSGSADTDSYKLGLYATYMHEAGSFLDAMLKVGRIDASYDLNNGVTESGDYMYTGVIAGIETGHRWTLNQFYVEPQIQLTYSYLQAETYSTAIRTVDFDSTKSLIGRIGFMTGMNFAQDKGSAYLKASYNHDFLGDMTGRFYSATHNISFSEELDQNWGEVSLGASYSMTDSLNGFVDVSRTFGGDIDQKWRVNLGARYQF